MNMHSDFKLQRNEVFRISTHMLGFLNLLLGSNQEALGTHYVYLSNRWVAYFEQVSSGGFLNQHNYKLNDRKVQACSKPEIFQKSVSSRNFLDSLNTRYFPFVDHLHYVTNSFKMGWAVLEQKSLVSDSLAVSRFDHAWNG